MWKIVVNGLGHANDPQRISPFDRLFVNLMRGVLRIVSTRVKEKANVVCLKDFEQAIHVLGRLIGICFEIDFVSAGTQGSCWRVLQRFDGLGFLFVDIDKLLIENAINTVETSVNFLNVLVAACLLDDSCHAGVDDSGGASRLCDQEIAAKCIRCFGRFHIIN